MKKILTLSALFCLLVLGMQTTSAQSKTFSVNSFDEVIISPHIEVIFEKADQESVVIENIDVDMDKLNVEVKGNTLHVYLDDAKVYTKSKKVKYDDYKGSHAIYDGTMVSAKIYYRDLELVSLRGDETHEFESALDGDEFKLLVYGEPEVYVSEIELDEFYATLYGEGYLEVKGGTASRQKIVSYGESEVNTMAVDNKSAKVTAYGEGRVRLSVTDDLKVTAYGEASIHYKGSPSLSKGIVIGEARIHQIN